MLYKKSFIKKWLIRCIHLPPFMLLLHVWYPIIFSWHLSISVLHTWPFISYCLLSCFCLIILSSVFLSPHVSFCSCSAAPHRYLSPPASLLLFHSTCLSSVLSSFATIHAFSWPVPVFFSLSPFLILCSATHLSIYLLLPPFLLLLLASKMRLLCRFRYLESEGSHHRLTIPRSSMYFVFTI